MSATATSLRQRSVESQATLRDTRHPDAAAAEEMCAWSRWLALGGATPNTLYTYSWTADKLLEAFPDIAFADFTDVHLTYVLTKTTAKSRPRWSAVFRNWFGWGVKSRRIERNPCDLLPDFRKPLQQVVEVFTPEEEAALRALPGPNGTLLALLFDTGIRKAEARMLTARRVDFHTQRLIVIEGAKGGKQRVVPIDEDSAPGLLSRLDYLFTTEGINGPDHLWPIRPGGGRHVVRDRPITSPSMHKWWVDRIEEAGVFYRRLHTTRHTMATRWRQRGLDMGDIQLLLGHESIATTQRIYVHTDAEDVRRRMVAARVSEANR